MKPRVLLAVVLSAAVVSAGVVLTGSAPSAAGEPPHNGVNPVEDGQEIGAGAGRPGTERTRDITGKFSRSSGPNNLCMDGVAGEWQRWGDEPWHASFPAPERGPGVPEDAEFWYLHCPQLASIEVPGIERGHWSNSGAPNPPPSAAELVLPAWAYVKGLLKNPAVTLSPPEGDKSVINIPTFVTIGNPQPSTTYIAGAAGVEVWIAVVPTVALHPGEPPANGETSSPDVPCDDDGTTYDPNGPAPKQQADGACAHIYEHRSSADDPWDGEVAITWNVTWGSNQAGQNGDFDVAPSETGFQRIVEEVQTVVIDSDT
jgi:hypothetical protein